MQIAVGQLTGAAAGQKAAGAAAEGGDGFGNLLVHWMAGSQGDAAGDGAAQNGEGALSGQAAVVQALLAEAAALKDGGAANEALVYRLTGGGNGAAEGERAPLGQTAEAGRASGELQALLTGASGERIGARLDELLQLIDEGGLREDALTGQEIAGLTGDLNELLLTLFGYAPLTNANGQAAADGQAATAARADAPLGAALAETLAVLKALAQAGQLQPLKKEEASAIAFKLDQLKEQLLSPAGKAVDPQLAATASQTSQATVGDAEEAPLAAQQAASAKPLSTLARHPMQPSLLTALGESTARQPMQQPSATEGTLPAAQAAQTAASSQSLSKLAHQPMHPSLLSALGETAAEQSAQPPQAPHSAVPPQIAQPVSMPAADAKPDAPQTVPVQRFADVMAGMAVKQFGLTNANGVSEVKISLVPEHLGQVDIKLTMHNGQLTAHIVAENAMARDMLDNQLAQLRSSLHAQGIQVDKLEVSHNPEPSTSFQEQRGQGGSGQAFEGRNGRHGGRTDEGASEFEEELVAQVVINGLGYGRALNVTA